MNSFKLYAEDCCAANFVVAFFSAYWIHQEGMTSAVMDQKSRSEKLHNFNLQNVFYHKNGFIIIVLFAMIVHLAISCGSYSGFGEKPIYGDFEAQRHWMEITVNLPIEQWYVNGTDNDLNYWGLDYPPLTAYHSYLLGKMYAVGVEIYFYDTQFISETINKSWVELYTSRGIENLQHKFFMRLSVLFTMWLLYYLIFYYYLTHLSGLKYQNYYAAIIILYPGLISVDSGHFQYNHIALGLFLGAYVLFVNVHLSFGSLLFVLAVHFKQMELYHALPFALFLLSPAIRLLIFRALSIGFVIALSVISLWWPLRHTDGFPLTILHRIFPFYRGIFEDKVANFWCFMNVIIKLKQRFSTEFLIQTRQLFLLLLSVTLLYFVFELFFVLCIISNIIANAFSTFLVFLSHVPLLLSIARYQNSNNLKQGLFLSALSFFLFSYHVHEKSILFAAVPALLFWPRHRSLVSWFLVISSISLYPLCVQDGNSLHLALFLFYYVLIIPAVPKLYSWKGAVIHSSCITGFLLCFLMLCLSPPRRFPHLFPLLIAMYSFAHFILFFTYVNLRLLNENFMMLFKQKQH
uniref:Alpha-1,3-glucosyltransferase n=1 Tax=Syphacia muris TaxID=451379 RepID=A0A0N5AJE6_9BILA